MLVRPIKIAPAERNFFMISASLAAGALFLRTREPAMVVSPATSNKSLMDIGIPAIGDRTSSSALNLSIAIA